jgi:hypothetical protein
VREASLVVRVDAAQDITNPGRQREPRRKALEYASQWPIHEGDPMGQTTVQRTLRKRATRQLCLRPLSLGNRVGWGLCLLNLQNSSLFPLFIVKLDSGLLTKLESEISGAMRVLRTRSAISPCLLARLTRCTPSATRLRRRTSRRFTGYYPPTRKMARGLEFGTQPFDVPRREVITAGPMFGTPKYRWLPAKSKIKTRFLLFYAPVPEGF